jgi:hypothetical protein
MHPFLFRYWNKLFNFIVCVYSSVLLGADESATCGVQVESVFFQDSIRLSGLAASALLV